VEEDYGEGMMALDWEDRNGMEEGGYSLNETMRDWTLKRHQNQDEIAQARQRVSVPEEGALS